MIAHGKIIVPTDFSDQSSEALRRACIMARQFKAEVHLVHVIEAPVYIDADLLLMPPIDAAIRIQHEVASKRIAEQLDSVEAENVVVHTKIEDADINPAQTICELAKALPADLIVIGRHSEKGVLEHLFIGSTAEEVVRRAPCSVLVTMPHGLFTD